MLKLKYILFAFLFAFALKGMAQNAHRKIGVSVGDIAPNISLPNLEGDTIDLFDLRGQVVLIDFWASWCGACRKENPNIVKNYNMYKDSSFTIGEGFTVFSVSLDTQKHFWLGVIEKEVLDWPYHVSDLLGWFSPVVSLYQFDTIPESLLIDKDGVIVSTRARGQMLSLLLGKYVIPSTQH